MTAIDTGQFVLVRDAIVVAFALLLAAYEVIYAGARPIVLSWLTGLLLSPLLLRADRVRRNGQDGTT